MRPAIRGLIEGFYDRTWTWEERGRVAEFVATRGFDTYVYAPKMDRFQNTHWRRRYPAAHRRSLVAFRDRCAELGMELWTGMRPVGISYADGEDAEVLIGKLRDFLELGADRVVLLADDIPFELDERGASRFETLADAHVWLVGRVLAGLDVDPERLVFVPTEYHGFGSPYLETLGTGLAPEVAVCWTGPKICSPTVTTPDVQRIAAKLGRRPLLWDNYPVNDAVMRGELHVGPIRGRDATLGDELQGILVNPALEPELTLIPLATWADYLCSPDTYDADAAWRRALQTVAGSSADAVAVMANAMDRSVISQNWSPPRMNVLRAAVDELDRMENRRLAADLAPFTEALFARATPR